MATATGIVHLTIALPVSLLILGCLALPITSAKAGPISYIVTTTNDSDAGSLRQAIADLNAGHVAGTIQFNIPGTAPFTISLLSQLPAIVPPVIMDATTQPGFTGTPIVELDGSAAGNSANGLILVGGNGTVRGLAINRFAGQGIVTLIGGGNTIQGNFIGTDISGTLNLGNGGSGVVINSGYGNVIGGISPAQANLIAFNGKAGIAILWGTNNQVRGNSIFANSGLAIDLGATGSPLANDFGDNDTGPNNLQNFPVLTEVTGISNSISITGTLDTVVNSIFQIDFYASPAAVSNSFTEGKIYIGSASVGTDASGHGAFNVSFPAVVPASSLLSATATDAAGNTSEFADSLPFIPENPVDVVMSVNATPNPVLFGDQLTMTVTLTNLGNTPATGVVVTNLLPASLSYAYSVATLGATAAGSNQVVWSLGTLAPGGVATMTVYASSGTIGTYTNTAILSQNEFNLDQAGSTNLLPITVYPPSTSKVTAQPANQLLNLGGLLNLLVGVLTPNNAHYQWRLNGANIPGATNATYSKASLLAIDGGMYTVVVSDQFGAETSQGALISLSGLLSLPASDNFATRGPVINLLGPETCDNFNATSEPGEPLHAGVPGGKSVWFTWMPLLNGVATFTTQGSSFDTLLAVYTGNNLSNLTEVVSDDDDGGFYTSRVVFNAVGGTTYSIAVDGAYGATGHIVLAGSENILAAGVPRITLQPVNQIVNFGDTAAFSIQTAGNGLSYQWYQDDAAIPGATTTNLLVKNVSTASVGLYTVKVSSSSSSVFSKPASLQISVLDGSVNPGGVAQDKYQTAYTAALTGNQPVRPMKSGGFSFGPSNGGYVKDAGGTARGYSSTQIFSVYRGATQYGEPNHCDAAGGNSAWTSVQAVDNGVMTIDTDGSNFRTILGVYTGNGTDFSSLAPVACDIGSGSGGTNSRVVFAATSNTVYYVAVDSVTGGPGTVVLNANLAVPPAITVQPVTRTVAPGATVSLAAAASGHLSPICQWMYNGAIVPGATNSTFTITNFQPSFCGTYQMAATNSLGSVLTSPASLLLNAGLQLDTFSFNVGSHTCAMRLLGTAGASYVIQTSTDLVTWSPLATNTAASGIWAFCDTHATNALGYYRAVPGH